MDVKPHCMACTVHCHTNTGCQTVLHGMYCSMSYKHWMSNHTAWHALYNVIQILDVKLYCMACTVQWHTNIGCQTILHGMHCTMSYKHYMSNYTAYMCHTMSNKDWMSNHTAWHALYNVIQTLDVKLYCIYAPYNVIHRLDVKPYCMASTVQCLTDTTMSNYTARHDYTMHYTVSYKHCMSNHAAWQ